MRKIMVIYQPLQGNTATEKNKNKKMKKSC